MGTRINTIMQTCFFAISGVLPRDAGDRADQARDREDLRASAATRSCSATSRRSTRRSPICTRWPCPRRRPPSRHLPPPFRQTRRTSCKRVTAVMLANQGDRLPVSAFPVDGTWPTGTAQWEKRNIAAEIPVWDAALCIQCNKCALVCPHAAIRVKVYPAGARGRRAGDVQARARSRAPICAASYTVQVAPEDCTGCALCVMVCPAKDKANPRTRRSTWRRSRRCATPSATNYAFFLDLPEADRDARQARREGHAVPQPLFEFSGACAGCGETPYIKLLTQLFGDRAGDRQRHRLLVDLRRQPADDAVHDQSRRPRSGVGELAVRGQRRVRARACGWRSISTTARARDARQALAPTLPGGPRRRDPDGRPAHARRASSAQRAAGRGAEARWPSVLSGPAPAHARRLPREEERVDRRRRRLGLRHRLRRPRSRARQRRERQHPRARHRGLLEHRRPAVEGDADRRGREVRRRRQDRRARRTSG